MPGWVFGPDVGLPDAGWMDEAEYQSKLNPATQILPTVEVSQELRAAVVPTSQRDPALFTTADGSEYRRLRPSDFSYAA